MRVLQWRRRVGGGKGGGEEVLMLKNCSRSAGSRTMWSFGERDMEHHTAAITIKEWSHGCVAPQANGRGRQWRAPLGVRYTEVTLPRMPLASITQIASTLPYLREYLLLCSDKTAAIPVSCRCLHHGFGGPRKHEEPAYVHESNPLAFCTLH